MITEIFSLLSSLDITKNNKLDKKFDFNLSRNRIRSISAYSSNSIFYFPTIVIDQATPDEIAMVSRMLEKSYASFVITCISLMPFHRIHADDQGSIEEYLSQFHQNLGISGGSSVAMGKVLGLVNTLEESSSWVDPSDPDVQATQKFLMECWERSRKNCTDFVKTVSETVSLNDMFQAAPVDPVTKVMQEQYMKTREELDTWGFLGEATGDEFDDDNILDMSDEDIMAQIFARPVYHDGMEEDDDEGLEDEYPEIDDLLEASSGSGNPKFDKYYDKLEKRLNDSRFQMFGSATAVEDIAIGVEINALISACRTEDEFKKAKEICSRFGSSNSEIGRSMQSSIDSAIERQRRRLKEGKIKNESAAEPLDEGNVKAAIDSIMFSLQSVSENKILSCSNLTKLRSLEAKLNKLKSKYAKYLNRYKRKYKENQKTGSKSKLQIRFNGSTISNPKAFMQQYGGYIKIINKRLKLIEKRREELRKRKGGSASTEPKAVSKEKTSEKDAALKEAAAAMTTLTDLDMQNIDACLEAADKMLQAPDSEIFSYIDEASDADDWQNFDNERRMKALGSRINSVNAQRRAEEDLYKASMARKDAQRETDRAKYEAEKSKDARRIAELEKKVGEKDPRDPEAGAEYDRNARRSQVNMVRAAIRNDYTGHKTFDREIFTDMEMKKANEAVPTFARANIGFIVDETEQVITRSVLVGIKVYIHKIAAMDLVNDIYNCIINKRKFLKFVKFISGEEKSLADLLFSFKEMRLDALNTRSSTKRWASAFRQRKRLSKMSVPYLMKEYTPNGSVVLTMDAVQYIKDEYGIDIMTPDHVKMLMDASFLLGFVILDQANEIVYVTYDGHGGNFQQYTYDMLVREQELSNKTMRELYRTLSR